MNNTAQWSKLKSKNNKELMPVLYQVLKILKTFNSLTLYDIGFYGLSKFLFINDNIKNADKVSESTLLFDITFGDVQDAITIKVSNDRIWYFEKTFNVRYLFSTPEETIFMDTLKSDMKHVNYELLMLVKDIKDTLIKAFKNETE